MRTYSTWRPEPRCRGGKNRSRPAAKEVWSFESETTPAAGADPRTSLAPRTPSQAGFEPSLAERLARECGVDLHALIELVERGCPPVLAARILAPLEHERREC